jgi:2-(3-amino-3-carboxypropyl)histidine synthase
MKTSTTSTFDLEEERLKEEIRKRGAKRVLIQLPEGLKAEGPRLASLAEKWGAVAIVSADPCYGACDLAVQEAESLGADLLVHFGHSEMASQQRVPIIYIEAKTAASTKPAVKKALPLLKPWKHIGLVTTIQHVDMLGEARTTLLETGKSVAVGDAGRLKHAGQVTGCDYSNASAISKEVDAFLFVGGGRFHAIGVELAASKPTVVADPYEQKAYSVDNEVQRILKQRWASIQEAGNALRFGVLIGLKSGQKRIDEALKAKESLEKKGKSVALLALREVTPEALMQFPSLDAFVNTACPRISLDEANRFRKPVLTLNETLVIVGELKWEELLKRGWFAA